MLIYISEHTGLIFGLFILFDFLDRIFSFFGIIKYVIRLIFEKATAEELNNLSCGMFLLANFFISRILLELAQGIVYMYLTGFEQDTSILFALMFVLQALAIIAENTPDREEIGNLMEDGISSYTSAANLLLKTSIGAVMLIPQLAFSFDVEHDEFHSFPFLVCLTIFLWILNNLNDNLQMTQPGSLVAAFSIAVYFVRQLSALAFLLMSLVLVCIKLLFLQFDSDFVWVVSFMILTFFSMGFLCALSSRIVMFMKNIFQRRPIEGERPIENDLVNDSFERDVIQLEL